MVQDMVNAHKVDITLAQQAKGFVDTLKATFPSFSSFKEGFYSMCLMIAVVLAGLVLLPCVLRQVIKQIQTLKIDIKRVKLEQLKHKPPPPLT